MKKWMMGGAAASLILVGIAAKTYESTGRPSHTEKCIIEQKALMPEPKLEAILCSYSVPRIPKSDCTAKPDIRQLSDRVRELQGCIKGMKLPAKFDYITAKDTWQNFDYEKAYRISTRLVELGKLNIDDKELFVQACRYWPLIKYYSENLDRSRVDPKLSLLVAILESELVEETMSNNREGYHDTGLFQINSHWGHVFQKAYGGSVHWTHGRDFTYTPNNILVGLHYIRDHLAAIKCSSKNLEDMYPVEIFKLYNGYTSGKPRLKRPDGRHVRIAQYLEKMMFLPFVDAVSADGKLVKERARGIVLAEAPKTPSHFD